MYQLILTLFSLIFASLNFYFNDTDKNSYSSETTEEAFETTNKAKNSSSSKKKKPKRNRSAFIIFSSEMRAKLRNDKQSKLNSNEMMVKLAELWKNLAESEKKKYHDQADQEKVRYNTELNNFYQKNPFEVIQNKTKKNHIKKPCSAYAIYLKETKLEIKQERPELKMADILKIVAERWKLLTEERRAIFQKKALQEKEATKAKLSQQNQLDEEALKKDSNKKNSPTSKRSQKSVQDPIKVEGDVKVENFQTSFEPAFNKRGVLNQNLPTTYNNYFVPTPLFSEFSVETGHYNFNMFGFNNSEAQQCNYNNNFSNLLNYLPPGYMPQQRKSLDVLSDFPPFQAKTDSFYVKDENIDDDFDSEECDPSTLEMTPSSNIMGTSSSQCLNDCTSLDDDFKLDNEFDRTLENFSHYGNYKGMVEDYNTYV